MSSTEIDNDNSSSSSDEDVVFANMMHQHQGVFLQQQLNDIATATMLVESEQNNWGGSVPGCAYINRGRVEGNNRFKADYFGSTPVFDHTYFRRHRMSRNLFFRTRSDLKLHDRYWLKKRDARQVVGLSSYHKIDAALQVLAYGTTTDAQDQYFRIGASTTLECVKLFCKHVVQMYGTQYLRRPNLADIARLLHVAEMRGFPGMLGSLDCMHWGWKNCPTSMAGQYRGRHGGCTMILEAVASYDLWIWHAYFGMPGTNNDINAINRSNLFHEIAMGRAPPANYNLFNRSYDVGYYLADGIYPKWSTLV